MPIFYLKTAITLSIAFALIGCLSDWQESRSYPSPDGRHTIVVTLEIQGANDPEPLWQHISLYRTGEEEKNKPGNLFIYSSRPAPKVQWKGPGDLHIEINDVSYTFTGPMDSKLSREISITTLIKQPPRSNED